MRNKCEEVEGTGSSAEPYAEEEDRDWRRRFLATLPIAVALDKHLPYFQAEIKLKCSHHHRHRASPPVPCELCIKVDQSSKSHALTGICVSETVWYPANTTDQGTVIRQASWGGMRKCTTYSNLSSLRHSVRYSYIMIGPQCVPPSPCHVQCVVKQNTSTKVGN